MQPNDQQGYYQPDQNQSAQPQPVTPLPQQPAPTVDPAALQAALDEPTPGAVPQQPQPLADQFEEQELEDEGGELAGETVTWVAQEYIHQEKGALWFILFAIIVIGLGAVSIFLMNSWSFAVLLGVIALVVIVYTRRPPRQLTYALTDDGLMIDNTLHKFSAFKSFGVIRDGEEFSVMLIPVQRFQPGITVYFPEESGEAIVDVLGSRLPMRDLHLDAVDRIVRLLRL